MFNPYLHGSNSSVLALLDKTDFSLLSPIQMLENYQLAPLTGEIHGGGLGRLSDRSNTAFGVLRSQTGYTLERIVRDYGHTGQVRFLSTREDLILNVKRSLRGGIPSAFSNLSILIIEIARAKQRGIANNEFATEAEIENLLKNLEAVIQFYYLMLLLGTHINPKVSTKEAQEDTYYAVLTHLTFENLLQKIISSQIDLKSIYAASTPDLTPIERLLSLPKCLTIQAEVTRAGEVVTLPETEIFLAIPPDSNAHAQYPMPNSPAYFFRSIQSDRYQTGVFLAELTTKIIPNNFFQEFHKQILELLPVLQSRIDLLKKILQKDPVQVVDPHSQRFLESPFQIIFVCEDSEKIKLMDAAKQEYRACQPLVIGEDIKILVTRSKAHQEVLANYLAAHRLDTVEVILLDQLMQSRSSGISPIVSMKETLRAQLTEYTARMEGCKQPNQSIDFSSGLWFFKQSRAQSREADYYLAQQLLEDLNDQTPSLRVALSDAPQKRAEIIQRKGLFSLAPRSINGCELNAILKLAS